MYTKRQKPVFVHKSNWGMGDIIVGQGKGSPSKNTIFLNLKSGKIQTSSQSINSKPEFENIGLSKENSFASIYMNFEPPTPHQQEKKI